MTSTKPNDLDNEVNEDMDTQTISPASPLPPEKAATGSSASGQSGTLVSKGRRGGDLTKITANAPRPRGRGSSQGDKSPKRAPKFTGKRDERSTSSVNGGRNRGPHNWHYSPKTPNQKSSATKTPKSKIMAHNYIILWNFRGLRCNREDIEWLISKYSPAAICLQETKLKTEHTPTFKHYTIHYKSNDQRHGDQLMVMSVFLSKTNPSIVKFIFKLICRL